MKKPISLRVEETLITAAEEQFGGRADGLQTAIEGYFAIQKRTVSEIKGKFTENELSCIMDAFLSTLISSALQANPEYIAIQLQDSEKYDGILRKWQVSDSIFEKVRALTSAQAYFLLETIKK